MSRIPPAVLGLLIANAAVFLAGLSPQLHEWLLQHGAFWFTRNPNFAPHQVVSYMFLHGSPGHILFNMFGLFSFGVHLESRWGTRRFLLFYCLCGVGAALVQSGVNLYQFQALENKLISAGLPAPMIDSILATGRGPIPLDPGAREALAHLYRIYVAPMIGASGAIYGILVAFGLLYPNAKLALIFVPVPVAAKIFIPILLALDLFSGITGFSLFGGGIAHFAHLGGALIGFLLMLLWRRPPETRPF